MNVLPILSKIAATSHELFLSTYTWLLWERNWILIVLNSIEDANGYPYLMAASWMFTALMSHGIPVSVQSRRRMKVKTGVSEVHQSPMASTGNTALSKAQWVGQELERDDRIRRSGNTQEEGAH